MSEQREIIFRLILGGKIVGYEKHLCDDFSKHIYIYHSPNGNNWWSVETNSNYYILHDQKNQYIGQLDFNGYRIFENDIVSVLADYIFASEREKFKAQISYFPSVGGFKYIVLGDDPHLRDISSLQEIRVIGNIYDGEAEMNLSDYLLETREK